MRLEKLRDIASRIPRDCGDSGCVFGQPTGLVTNGGCRCLRSTSNVRDCGYIIAHIDTLLDVVELAEKNLPYLLTSNLIRGRKLQEALAKLEAVE